jgi:transitional endoplasmic reticulum ATPase
VWDDLVLSAGVIEQLDRARAGVLESVSQHPARAAAFNLLLWGQPGTGKTSILRAFANSLDGVNSVGAHAIDVTGGHIGETSNRVRAVFTRARDAAPALLIIDLEQGPYSDDCLAPSPESLAPRDGFSYVDQEIVMAMRAEMDRLRADNAPVWILAETFDLARVDRAVLSRFNVRIETPLPEAARCEILRRKIAAWGPRTSFDVGEVSSLLAKQTAGESGRGLENIVRSAWDRVLRGGAPDTSPTAEDLFHVILRRKRIVPAPGGAQ